MTFNIIAPAPLVHQSHAVNIGGVLMAPFGALITGLDWAFQLVLNGVRDVAFAINGDIPDDKEKGDMFIADIVYNKLDIIDANVFNPDTENPLLKPDNGEGITGIVQQWYGVTRMMAIAASLVILVYVAIKILIASTGQDKAKYTELLKDWLLSLLLIFTLHYVLAAILFVSDELVKFFSSMIASGENFDYKKLQDGAFLVSDVSIIYALVWMAFLIYTLVFLILYVKRLILICFFVVVSPLIVLLSTINKLRGKGSGILENWLKEFIANVAMQPIDALLFTIIGSTIFMCVEAEQPILALAFVIAFLPMRNWVLKYFEQESKENDVKGAAKLAVGGAKATAAVGGHLSNIQRKPKFDTSNIDKARAGAKLGGTGANGGGSGGDATGGSFAGNGANPKIATEGATAVAGNGSSKGVATSAPSSYANGMGLAGAYGVRPDLYSQGMQGEGKGSVSSSGQVASGAKPDAFDRLNQSMRQKELANKRTAGNLVKGAGRLAGKAAVKGVGMYAGAVMGGLNAIAGGDFSKGYSVASGVTDRLAGKGLGAAGRYAGAMVDGAVAGEGVGGSIKGAFGGLADEAKDDINYVKDSVTTAVSDFVTGQNTADDRVAMAEFFQDAEVVDQMYEMIETCGEGHPLYEEYQNTNDLSARRSIAQQFYMENAVASYGVERFDDLVKRSKGSDIKAMMSVMQKQKSALTGKNAKNKLDSVKQRSLNYYQNNN